MESGINVLQPKRSASSGITPQGRKRLKLSSESFPYSSHDKAIPEAPNNSPHVEDRLKCLETGRFGSVTKDIEALIARKMQVLGPYFARYPKLVTQELKVAVDPKKGIVMSHEKAIELKEEHIKKDAPAAQPVLIIDSDEEDDTDIKSSLPFNEAVLLKSLHSPAMNMTTGCHAPIAYDGNSEDLKFVPTLAAKDKTQTDKGVYVGLQEEEDHEHSNKDASAAQPVVIIDSDEEDNRDKESSLPFNEVMLQKSLHSPALKMIEHPAPIAYHGESEDLKFEATLAAKDNTQRDKGVYVGVQEKEDHEEHPASFAYHGESEDLNFEATLAAKDNTQRDKGVYVGVQEKEDREVDTEDDGLEDIWREMSMAVECSKDVSVNPPPEEEVEKDADCDHSFVLKDDLGYVCRVCGIIDRGIETIFEFQYKVKRSTRTYAADSWNGKAKTDLYGIKIAEDDITLSEISAHPRHMKQMKSHQIEGFNFLVRNLVGDNPGGCILAHAPGSGKTFMIISFMQGFLGKYPNARPLVVLPKGILSTWKKEFQTWQVENIPLYDFYSAKADSRSQQLEVLKQWVERKSILFLGYTQFSSIICDTSTSTTSVSCQEILLQQPSILILDEGHNPRNEETDIVQSLARVKTPRKVVLSGTLYQNHVKEVFNILNLVRPKFMQMEASRLIEKRIHSRVNISSKKNFFDLVEDTLQKDPDFKRKISVIKDLREMTSKVLHYYKGDFLDELPGLVDYTVLLNLTPKQKHEKEILENKSGLGKFKKSFVGSALYLHPGLKPVTEKKSGENSESDQMVDDLIEKLDVKDGVKSKFFLNILNLCESSGEKLLVFSQYLLPLRFLERLVMKRKGWSVGKEIFEISGDASFEQRELSMYKFNNSPDAKVLFGSIKACGEGISLVGASRVLVLDVHLNPSVTRQAIGRAFRPGQTKKVFVYRLIAADSHEEDDHLTSFKKESISKMWFEWNEYCGDQAFKVETVSVKECGDLFLESSKLGEDVKALYKR